jgi:hypothetical protein
METDPRCDHYFPFPDELGLDEEAMPGGAERGDCVCGTSYDPVYDEQANHDEDTEPHRNFVGEYVDCNGNEL